MELKEACKLIDDVILKTTMEQFKHVKLEDRSILSDKYFTAMEGAKIERGDVTTPKFLRDKMISTIPSEFWKTPKKVIEPACGRGGFLLDIINNFMEGLKDEIKDIGERYKFIVENCVWFADIFETNIDICKKIIDPDNEFKLNYFVCDSLKHDFKIKFDAVVMNPPYNKHGIMKGATAYQEFTLRALAEWVNDDGYLLVVIPPGWRRPQTVRSRWRTMFKTMAHDNQIISLFMNSIDTGKKLFNCSTRFDEILIKKTPCTTTTKITDFKNVVSILNLLEYEWLPNYSIEYINSLMGGNSFYIRSTRRLTDVKNIPDEKYKYKVIKTVNKTKVNYLYSPIQSVVGLYGVPKIVWDRNGGIRNLVIDETGEYMCSGECICIKYTTKKNADYITKKLLSKEFNNNIMNACNYSMYQLEAVIFERFNDSFYTDPN